MPIILLRHRLRHLNFFLSHSSPNPVALLPSGDRPGVVAAADAAPRPPYDGLCAACPRPLRGRERATRPSHTAAACPPLRKAVFSSLRDGDARRHSEHLLVGLGEWMACLRARLRSGATRKVEADDSPHGWALREGSVSVRLFSIDPFPNSPFDLFSKLNATTMLTRKHKC